MALFNHSFSPSQRNHGEMVIPCVCDRWPTKVFAIDCLQKIIAACEEDKTHFDLVLAKDLKNSTGKGESQ